MLLTHVMDVMFMDVMFRLVFWEMDGRRVLLGLGLLCGVVLLAVDWFAPYDVAWCRISPWKYTSLRAVSTWVGSLGDVLCRVPHAFSFTSSPIGRVTGPRSCEIADPFTGLVTFNHEFEVMLLHDARLLWSPARPDPSWRPIYGPCRAPDDFQLGFQLEGDGGCSILATRATIRGAATLWVQQLPPGSDPSIMKRVSLIAALLPLWLLLALWGVALGGIAVLNRVVPPFQQALAPLHQRIEAMKRRFANSKLAFVLCRFAHIAWPWVDLVWRRFLRPWIECTQAALVCCVNCWTRVCREAGHDMLVALTTEKLSETHRCAPRNPYYNPHNLLWEEHVYGVRCGTCGQTL